MHKNKGLVYIIILVFVSANETIVEVRM